LFQLFPSFKKFTFPSGPIQSQLVLKSMRAHGTIRQRSYKNKRLTWRGECAQVRGLADTCAGAQRKQNSFCQFTSTTPTAHNLNSGRFISL